MWKIGHIEIKSKAILAPMAGVTGHPFRVLCKEQGAGVVYTEFVSANGIIRENRKTLDMMKFTETERPIGVQIFGESPEVLAQSAKYIEETVKPDIIDLNFGCPVPKVTKRGGGSAILKDLPLMDEVAQAVVEAVSIPVTAKIRSGWNNGCIVAPVAAAALQDAGIAALTLHPRTTKQLYTGEADWSLITETRKAISIPLIGNGDIRSAQDAKRMMDETGCDAVMVGRRALGNPWIFREINEYLNQGTIPDAIRLIDRVKLCHRHLYMETQAMGATRGTNYIKKHLSWYLKGFPGASAYRQRLYTIMEFGHMDAEINKIIEELEADHELANFSYREEGPLFPNVPGSKDNY
ncbi:MAG: tRNA dihydrouridine synthase DusB [Candidatus Marinimicrobia bacterium]|nr:tRNA dihydrouridine synthase DusB [Candidatus Neomarinimicrobiota bacterium]